MRIEASGFFDRPLDAVALLGGLRGEHGAAAREHHMSTEAVRDRCGNDMSVPAAR